jgi:hypothetical protein
LSQRAERVPFSLVLLAPVTALTYTVLSAIFLMNSTNTNTFGTLGLTFNHGIAGLDGAQQATAGLGTPIPGIGTLHLGQHQQQQQQVPPPQQQATPANNSATGADLDGGPASALAGS